MSSRPAVLVCCAVVTALFTAASPALADVFEPIELVSQGSTPSAQQFEQADYAHHPAISGDGRYVVFDGSFGGVRGVWRRDLGSGTVEEVAPGDARLPSISEDGRYVSFTTAQKLVPGDGNEGPDVYVRDMEIRSSAACTQEAITGGTCPFELVSAPSGAVDEALTYHSEQPQHYGSLAAGRSALSADGRYVVFVTTAESNLAGANTPALQVAVRDRQTDRTELVSALIDPATGRPKTRIVGGEEQDEPVPLAVEAGEAFGAAYPGGLSTPSFPSAGEGTATTGASISADGSTVAWIGQQVNQQTPVLQRELSTMRVQYAEPLWRRVADGPRSPIRRVTGGSDPANAACAASGEVALAPGQPTLLDPCQGPFAIEGEALAGLWTLLNPIDALPRLSANGDRVALLVNAREIASGLEFGSSNGFSDDLYVVDMAAGLSRVQALRRMTEVAGATSGEVDRTAPILDFDISPDGSQVAFTTARTVFPLGSPAYISAPAAFPGMVEIYDADLANNTLTRVSHGFEGESAPSEATHPESSPGVDPYNVEREGASSPSFSAGGSSLAFTSTASNLVFGDGNAPSSGSPSGFDGSDAFLVARVPFGSAPVEAQISSAPPAPALSPEWRLGATARSRPDGSVLLDVELPGQGTLRVAARGTVVIESSARVGGAHGSVRRGHTTRTVATRTVASRTVASSSGGLVTIALDLARSYRALASQRGGLSSALSLLFTAAGHPDVRASVFASFIRTPPHPATGHLTARRRARPRGRAR